MNWQSKYQPANGNTPVGTGVFNGHRQVGDLTFNRPQPYIWPGGSTTSKERESFSECEMLLPIRDVANGTEATHLRGMKKKDVPCEACSGSGFIPTGFVLRSQGLNAEHGHQTADVHKSDLFLPCPICRGTGQRKRYNPRGAIL